MIYNYFPSLVIVIKAKDRDEAEKKTEVINGIINTALGDSDLPDHGDVGMVEDGELDDEED